MSAVRVVVLEGAFAPAIAASIAMLEVAASFAPRVKVEAPRFEVVSVAGGPVRVSGGMAILTAPLRPRAKADHSTWVIPGLGATTPADVRERVASDDAQKVAKAVARHIESGKAARGPLVAASCSAVFLLQAAGVLRGRRATTTWWLGGRLADLEPTCRVDASLMVCADGPIVTAGAAFAQTDLMLHLLRATTSPQLADLVARALLIDARQAQAEFVVPAMLANGDELVARVVAMIEKGLPEPPGVAALAAKLGMSERTLSRHVIRATGRSTISLVHAVKARRAQELLRSSRANIDEVAAQVGYQDASTLRRLLRKVGARSPRDQRARAESFDALRR